jgi:hypothetical protein
VNSKEENSEDFWANYAREFGIRKAKMAHPTKTAEWFSVGLEASPEAGNSLIEAI